MLVFQMMMPSARQLAMRQLHEAQRLALVHATKYEELSAAAERHAGQVRMYQDRAARLGGVLANNQEPAK